MRLRDKDLRICLIAYALTAASMAWGHESGDEFIDTFDTRLEIREDGALGITHIIDVHPHGDEIRRGLFFELPDEVGPLDRFSAALNGQAIAPDFDDGAVIVAADAPLALHETHRFEVRYRAGSPWWADASGAAELRWAPVIEQFDLAWKTASIELSWPNAAMRPRLPEAGSADGSTWRLRLDGPLSASGGSDRVGVLRFGIDESAVPAPSVRRYGADWIWRASLVLGSIALLAFLHTMWRAVGRDPELGRIASRETAPAGISPAAARFIDRMGFDDTTFVAALLSLRVRQALDLQLDDGGKRLRLERRHGGRATPSPGEQALLDALFESGDSVELEAGDERGRKAAEALKEKLGEEHRGRHFVTNDRQRTFGALAGLAVALAGLAGLIVQARDDLTPDPWVIGLGLVSLAVGAFAPLVYHGLFKAPTRAGVEVKRQIAGLKRYFGESSPVGETDRFVALLPYAVALDAEESWRDRFAEAGEDEADRDSVEILAWYREVQRHHDSAAALVPIIAAASGATAAGGAGASGGASAGGV